MKKRSIFTRRTVSNLIVVAAGVLLFLLFSNFGAVVGFGGTFLAVIAPFVVGLAVAFLLNLPMRFFENKVFGRLRRRRTWAIITTYVLFLALVGLVIGLVAPQLVGSVQALARNLERYLGNLNTFVQDMGRGLGIPVQMLDSFVFSYGDIMDWVMDTLNRFSPQLWEAGQQVGSGLLAFFTGFITGFIASVYMLASKEKLIVQARRVVYAILPPRAAREVMRIARLCNRVFSGFIGGKLLDSAIMGVLCFVGMSIMSLVGNLFGIVGLQMHYTLLISVVVGVTNVIPFFGPFIGAIPSAMILLIVNPWSALWFGVFILVLQQIDGNILGPRILGSSTGLPAMWVLVAIIVFGNLFGFVGMLLGVPATAVLYTLGSEVVERRLRRKKINDEAELQPVPAAGRKRKKTGGLPYAQPVAEDKEQSVRKVDRRAGTSPAENEATNKQSGRQDDGEQQ